MPWRSHASSSASLLSNFACCVASLASHSSFLRRKVCVVARPRGEAAAIELDDPRRELLEERAIVRDEDDGAGVVGEKGFEPLDRVDVEMVGRLVEQQQVGLRDQRPRQQHAAPPPARQRVDDGVGRQVEPRQHQLDALLEAPAVALFELVLQLAEPDQRAGEWSCSTSTAAW